LVASSFAGSSSLGAIGQPEAKAKWCSCAH